MNQNHIIMYLFSVNFLIFYNLRSIISRIITCQKCSFSFDRKKSGRENTELKYLIEI